MARVGRTRCGPGIPRARRLVERGDETVVFLSEHIPASVRLSRRIPYKDPRDLQFHREAYVLECIGTPAARKLARRISSPAAEFRPYDERPRFDGLGDPLPKGAVLRWGTDRFSVPWYGIGPMAISNDGKHAAMAPDLATIKGIRSSHESSVIYIWDALTGWLKAELPFAGSSESPIRFTSDGSRLVYQAEGHIVVVEVATGRETSQFATTLCAVTAFAL